MIELKQVSKSYKGNIILDDVSLSFSPGCVYGIKGDNGSGKSVLLRLVAGFAEADKGTIRQGGVRIGKGNYLRDSGIVIEKVDFLPYKTLQENLLLLQTFSDKITKEMVDYWIDYYHINTFRDTLYKNLSLGTKQKMALIQAFIHEPQVLLLDEPMNALDEESVDLTKNQIKRSGQKGIVIMTSHIGENIDDLCQMVYLVKAGKVLAL